MNREAKALAELQAQKKGTSRSRALDRYLT